MKYSRKQIAEAIKYWENQLELMNESLGMFTKFAKKKEEEPDESYLQRNFDKPVVPRKDNFRAKTDAEMEAEAKKMKDRMTADELDAYNKSMKKAEKEQLWREQNMRIVLDGSNRSFTINSEEAEFPVFAQLVTDFGLKIDMKRSDKRITSAIENGEDLLNLSKKYPLVAPDPGRPVRLWDSTREKKDMGGTMMDKLARMTPSEKVNYKSWIRYQRLRAQIENIENPVYIGEVTIDYGDISIDVPYTCKKDQKRLEDFRFSLRP